MGKKLKLANTNHSCCVSNGFKFKMARNTFCLLARKFTSPKDTLILISGEKFNKA